MSRDLPRTILGRTNLEVTRFGIGGTYCESVDGYKKALDCGVNYVDTARSYQGGEDEKLIGQAIQGRRHDLIVASKSARRDAEGARQELQTSLRALKTDYLDIFQLHHLNTEAENATKRWQPRWSIKSRPTSPRRRPSALHWRHRTRLGAN